MQSVVDSGATEFEKLAAFAKEEGIDLRSLNG